MAIKHLTFLLIFSLFTPLLAIAATPPSFEPNVFKVSSEFSFYETTDNYDEGGGSFDSLGDGKSYQRFGFDAKTYYAPNDKFSWFSRFSFAQSQSESLGVVRKNNKPTEAELGTHYRILKTPTNLTLHGSFIYPFTRVEPDTNPSNNDESIPGEGAVQFLAGLWVNGPIWGIDSHLYFAYNHRDEGRSHLLRYQLGLAKNNESFSFGGELYGFNSVSDDSFTDEPAERTIVTSTINASSFRYYSVNPSLLALRGWGQINLSESFNVRLGYDQSINGDNYAHGSTFFANLTFYIDTTRSKRNYNPSSRKTKKELKKFKVDSEQYDENLFKGRKKLKKDEKSKRQLLDETQKQLEGL